jgi:predicted lipid-binding transport protein (Tim44 family)
LPYFKSKPNFVAEHEWQGNDWPRVQIKERDVKKIFALLAIFVVSVSLLAATSAEARRFGGGQSIGMRRSAPMPARMAPQSSSPLQGQPQSQPVARPAPVATPTPQPVPQPGGASRWLGPLAGLAAGAGLMAMFSGMGGGFGGMGGFLMVLLVGGAVWFLFSMFRRRAAMAAPYPENPRYYEANAPQPCRPAASHIPSTVPDVGGGAVAAASEVPFVPAGFDVAGFLRQAKVSFIRLQAANDAGDLHDMRDYTTPELYAEISMQLQERGSAPQRTEVVRLDADLLSVDVEVGRTVASVRFTGLVQEEENHDPEAVDEVWHVVRHDANGVWLVAGIQQVN